MPPEGDHESMESDEALCQQVAGGDGAAFDRLVERYQQRAYRLAWSVLHDPEDARDLAQEAFVRVYQTAGTFEGRARFSTWFYRILLNLCLDHRRRHGWWRRAAALTESGALAAVANGHRPLAPEPGEQLDRDRRVARLWRAVEDLAPQQRAAVILHVQEELPTAEVAAVLNCSESTVRVHLHRALVALRKHMGND
jgi:RNA polymerase sigma-70 factor (ECF subfamily)